MNIMVPLPYVPPTVNQPYSNAAGVYTFVKYPITNY